MSRGAWWLTACIILGVLPVLAAGIGIAWLDPNDYKPEIIAAVRNATGRTLTLNGPVRLGRSLWPTIEVSDVTLANLPGGSRPDIARAERIEAQLSLPALLWRRIEVVKLTLTGPNILFEEVGGAPNWVFHPPKGMGAGAVGAGADGATTDGAAIGGEGVTGAAAAASGNPFQLRIRSVIVRNGMVTWRFPARTKVVGIRTLDLQHLVDDGPLRVDAVLVYSDNQPFSLRAVAQPTAGFAGPWTTQLAFAAFDTVASGQGTMDVAGHYDLQVEATAEAVEKLNALLPEMRLPAVHRLTLSTHLTNGPVPGDLPVVGATQLHFADANLDDRIPGLKLDATDVSLPAAGAAATVTSVGHWAGQAFTLGGTFGVPMHPDGRENLDLDLKAQAAAGSAKAVSGSLAIKGRLTLDTLRFAGLDAVATLRTPSLTAVGPLLSRRLPALTDVQFDGRLQVPADVGSVAFHGARLHTRQGDVAGDGTIGLGGTTAVDARLRSDKLDLNAMLPAFGIDLAAPAGPVSTTGPASAAGSASTTGGASATSSASVTGSASTKGAVSATGGASTSDPASPGGPVIPATPLPWALLRGPAIDVSGSFGEVSFRDQVWRKVELALQLKSGRVQVGTLRLALPGGPLEMSMTADASVDPVPVSVTAHAASVPLALFARYAGLPGPVSGTLRLDARLQANGQSAHELAASLDGTVSASAIDGQLSNAAFIKLTAASLDALGIHVPSQGETKFGCAGLVGSFAKGVGRFPTIALETTHLSLAGVGEVDLGQETVALKLNPQVQIAGSPVTVPVLVEGPFRAIAGRLDANGLDKLGLLIDALFGGDHPKTCSDAGLVASSAAGR